MNKLFSFLISLFLVTTLQSKEFVNTQLITNGDYGVELDWIYSIKDVGFGQMCVDGDDNIYISIGYSKNGCVLPNGVMMKSPREGKSGKCIVKYDAKGEIVWYKNLTGEATIVVHEIAELNDQEIFVLAGLSMPSTTSSSLQIEYDDKPLIAIGKDIPNDYIALKINKADGTVIDALSLTLGGKSDPETEDAMNFQFGEDGSIYLSTFIGENFTGLDTTRLKTDVRTHGGADAYYAKINPDFTLAWDFAIGGNRHDVPWAPKAYYMEYWDFFVQEEDAAKNWFVLTHDTLIIKASIFSDSVDVDPRPDHEVLVTPHWNNDAVLARYLLNGNEMPVLIDYQFTYTFALPHLLCKGENGKLYALNYYKDYDEIFYDHLCHYKEIDENFKTYDVDDYAHSLVSPTLLSLSEANSNPFINYDKDGNLWIDIQNVERGKTYDLQLDESNSLSLAANKDRTAAIVKYDSQSNFLWALGWQYSVWLDRYAHGYKGGIYMYGYGDEYDDYTVDFGVGETNKTIVENPAYILLRYVETFRVKASETEYGEIIVPDTLVRWGKSAEVTVIPEQGYVVESVTTSRGEILEPISSGVYRVDNVTDVVTINAKFKEASSVEDMLSSRICIYPNPVNDKMEIKTDLSYSISGVYDIQGKEVLKGNDENPSIDVQSLSSGIYNLKMTVNDVIVNKQFIKK